jgi:hypothetical protein
MIASAAVVTAQPPANTEGYQGALLYLGNSAESDIRQGHYVGLAGIANGDPATGDPYWYLSRKPAFFYRIPYTEHLGVNFAFEHRLVEVRGNTGKRCDHIGDIDAASAPPPAATRYIVGGFDNCHDGNRGQLAFFRVDDVWDGSPGVASAHAVLDVGDVQQAGAPWVAFGDTTTWRVGGTDKAAVRLYSSSGRTRDTDVLFEYTVLWEDVEQGGRIAYQHHRRIPLEDFAGNPVHLDRRQGGDLSTDGQLFFVSQGMTEVNLAELEQRDTDRRLLVFETAQEGEPWRLLKRSANTTAPFRFQTSIDQEPEGLSYFDVNEVPGYRENMPRGELFVALIDHATVKSWGPWYAPKTSRQAIYIKHYTARITVTPEDSVTAMVNDRWGGHGAWDHAQLVLQAGTYREELHLDARDLWAPPGDSSRGLVLRPQGEVWLVAP